MNKFLITWNWHLGKNFYEFKEVLTGSMFTRNCQISLNAKLKHFSCICLSPIFLMLLHYALKTFENIPLCSFSQHKYLWSLSHCPLQSVTQLIAIVAMIVNMTKNMKVTVVVQLQPWPLAIKRLLNNPYVNGVNLTKQKPLLKYRQHLETWHTLKRGLDL